MYRIYSDTLIIHPNFNQSLDTINELNKSICKKTNVDKNIITTIIFSNFKNFELISLKENKCLCLDRNFTRNRFNQPIDYLPKTITHLVLGGKFNNQINPKIKTLQFVEFYGEYNMPLDNLPNSIREIKICGWEFNQPINKLPKLLLYLIFSGTTNIFNQPINCNNQSVIKIDLERSKFNQPVNYLPPNLKILVLPNTFNQSVDNLPCTIEEIYFNKEFSQSLDYLPSSLKILSLGEKFSQSLDNLPNSIEKISLETNIISNIQSLVNLPKSVKEISFYSSLYSDKRINLKNLKSKIKIPDNIEIIYINNEKMIQFFEYGTNTQFIFSSANNK